MKLKINYEHAKQDKITLLDKYNDLKKVIIRKNL